MVSEDFVHASADAWTDCGETGAFFSRRGGIACGSVGIWFGFLGDSDFVFVAGVSASAFCGATGTLS
jgi:hypothetical protein